MSSKKYRKLPVEIEAIRFMGTWPSYHEVIQFMNVPALDTEQHGGDEPNELIIPTLEGDHRARIGDWIIKGVKGEFYPCKPEIFAMTYEEANG